VKSNAAGLVDLDDLRSKLDGSVAGMMLTNPNTLGLFETNVAEIAKLLHGVGAKLYIDGANLNAIMGVTRPGDWGADAMHVNAHKTLATPHGGGGPGAGPIGVAADLAPYLPLPVVEREGSGRFVLKASSEKSIGRVRGFAGQIGVLIRAYLYLRSLGPKGVRSAAENAVLNARYLQKACGDILESPYNGNTLHEFVLSARKLKAETGIRALDLAKRLIDHGLHPPTIYFPLIVKEAIMIEPTETESKADIDKFIDCMIEAAQLVDKDPQAFKSFPKNTPVTRPDEVKAAKDINCNFFAKS